MKNKKTYISVIIFFLTGVLFAEFMVFLSGRLRTGSKEDKTGTSEQIQIFVGDTDISEYTISGSSNPAKKLQSLIFAATGNKPTVKAFADKNNNRTIEIKRTAEKNGIFIENSRIRILGKDTAELENQIKVFANVYLGYAFAGEKNEHIIKPESGIIRIPTDIYNPEGETWIDEREPIICLWKTDTARGAYYKTDTNLNSEILSYSDDQLYTYVRMMKRLGYTGIQVTEMCSAWAQYGGYEYVHDRLKMMSKAAHSMDMNFTVWVWGAEFNGYGWDDPDVDYYDNWKYAHAYENPKALECFDKYYTIYADLAGYCDRVIAHFDDPGNLINDEDIAYFSGVLRDKFRDKNPDVNFGVSCYKDNHHIVNLNNALGGDVTIYSGARRTGDEKWEGFRTVCRDNGIEYGVWSWNLTEMEIDQLAEMNVNSKLIKDTYIRSSEEDFVLKPSYWSEMDSYHVLNVFSHYCAGRLLQDPTLDEKEILKEAAGSVAGEVYAEKLYEVLTLVEDARTGEDWESFRWGDGDYLLTSDKYDAGDIYTRAEKCIENLDEMIAADITDNTLPLPVTVTELLKMMRPHIVQIRDFAKFRTDLNDLKTDTKNYDTTEKLQKSVEEIYTPIHEYDAIIGLWGQPEARAQYELLDAFCAEHGLDTPQDPAFIFNRKKRIYGEFTTLQRTSSEMMYFSKTSLQWYSAYGEKESERLTDELIKDGLLGETSEGQVYIIDWEKYSRR